MGVETQEKGEIFNDYKNNKAISAFTHAEGRENIVGSKGFNIVNKVALEDQTCAIQADFTEEAMGAIYYSLTNGVDILVTIKLKNGTYDCIGKIKTIIDMTTVLIEQLNYDDEKYKNYESNSSSDGLTLWRHLLNDTVELDNEGNAISGENTNTIMFPQAPQYGTKDYGTCGHVEGKGNQVVADHGHAEGLYNIVGGKYGHAEGNNNLVFHNAHAEGNSNKATGYNSHAEGRSTSSIGLDSHSEGLTTVAYGKGTHAEGCETKAIGDYSHTEGIRAQVGEYAKGAHAEGCETQANNDYTHAEGYRSIASGDSAHAEGNGVEAAGWYSHAEGENTKTTSTAAHAEGANTVSSAYASHAEGLSTLATEQSAHAEGEGTEASASASHAEGFYTKATNRFTHAEGQQTTASGDSAHAEGIASKAISTGSHAEGVETIAGTKAYNIIGISENYTSNDASNYFIIDGLYESFSSIYDNLTEEEKVFSLKISNNYNRVGKIYAIEKYDENSTKVYVLLTDLSNGNPFTNSADKNLVRDNNGEITLNSKSNSFILCERPEIGTKDFGGGAHAEGYGNKALMDYSHAEGVYTTVYGRYGHAEGNGTIAHHNAHAEGNSSQALGYNSHAEGHSTTASGLDSHSEGVNTTASGTASHAEGDTTQATGENSHSEGRYTKSNGIGSHSEGTNTTANGKASHVEGDRGQSHGDFNHVEGVNGRAWGSQNHVEGVETWAGSEGNEVLITHVEGHGTRSNATWQHVQGRFNLPDSTKAHIVGNGSNDSKRSNAHTLDWNGNAWFAGKVCVGADNKELVTGDHKHPVVGNIEMVSKKLTDLDITCDYGEMSDWLNEQTNTLSSADSIYTSNGYSINQQGETSFSITFLCRDEYIMIHNCYASVKIDGVEHFAWSGSESEYKKTFTYSGNIKNNIEIDISYCDVRFDEFKIGVPQNGLMTVADKEKLDSLPGKKVLNGGEIFNAAETASGTYSHAEGEGTIASGRASHSEGCKSKATNQYTHAEGNNAQATGDTSHAEGFHTKAAGIRSHAQGCQTEAHGVDSHAEGFHTIALGDQQHTQGRHNIPDNENKYAHIVGNGDDWNRPSNAHTIDWQGNAWFAKDVYVGGTNQNEGSKLTTEEYVDTKTIKANRLASCSREEIESLEDRAFIISGHEDASYNGNFFGTRGTLDEPVVYRIAVSGNIDFVAYLNGSPSSYISIDGTYQVPHIYTNDNGYEQEKFEYSGEVKEYIEVSMQYADLHFKTFVLEETNDGLMAGTQVKELAECGASITELQAKTVALETQIGEISAALAQLHEYAQSLIGGSES